MVAAAFALFVVAVFGYYLHAKHSARKPVAAEARAGARPPSTFVEGPRFEASNPAFYGTQEPGGMVLRMTEATSTGLARKFSPEQVVMFSTSWCPYCAKARAVFEKNRVPYTELDVERNGEAKEFLERVMGMSGFPIIVIGNRVTLGFNEDQIQASLQEL